MFNLASTPLTVHTPTETYDEKRREEAKMVRIKRVADGGTAIAARSNRVGVLTTGSTSLMFSPLPAHRVLAPPLFYRCQ